MKLSTLNVCYLFPLFVLCFVCYYLSVLLFILPFNICFSCLIFVPSTECDHALHKSHIINIGMNSFVRWIRQRNLCDLSLHIVFQLWKFWRNCIFDRKMVSVFIRKFWYSDHHFCVITKASLKTAFAVTKIEFKGWRLNEEGVYCYHCIDCPFSCILLEQNLVRWFWRMYMKKTL